MFWNLVLFWFLMFYCQLSNSKDISFTLSVPPRRRDCFHETITIGVQYEVEYQVVIITVMLTARLN